MGLLLLMLACKGPDAVVGTTLPDDGGDLDFDGVPNLEDCNPTDPDVYPGAVDAPGDGIDADCDGEDPERGWAGEWEVVDLQALYANYPILVPGGSEGSLSIGDDGDARLDARALLDPSLVGAPIDVFAEIVHEGHAAPQARSDQLMLYLDGEVSVPTIDPETSYADLLCTLDGDELFCQGTLKALEITLETEARFQR